MTLTLPGRLARPRSLWLGLNRRVASLLPTGLYARSILIVIAPMVILQSVLTFVFMERHWQLVTTQLSAALTRDIAAVIDMYESYPRQKDNATLVRIAQERMDIDVELLPDGPLPPTLPRPFFSIVDGALSNQIRRLINRPFWLDTVGAPILSRSASS